MIDGRYTMDKQTLKNIRHTLNQVQVCGRDNLGKMLGCLVTLDELIDGAKAGTDDARQEDAHNADNDQ